MNEYPRLQGRIDGGFWEAKAHAPYGCDLHGRTDGHSPDHA